MEDRVQNLVSQVRAKIEGRIDGPQGLNKNEARRFRSQLKRAGFTKVSSGTERGMTWTMWEHPEDQDFLVSVDQGYMEPNSPTSVHAYRRIRPEQKGRLDEVLLDCLFSLIAEDDTTHEWTMMLERHNAGEITADDVAALGRELKGEPA